MENLFGKIKGDIDVDLNIQEGGFYYVFFQISRSSSGLITPSPPC